MNNRMNMLGSIALALGASLMSGCGSGNVAIRSEAFNTTGTSQSEMTTAALAAAPADVTDFKFCVTRVRLENEDGKFEEKDGNQEIEFQPGLIDLSAGTAKDWGKIDAPTGFKLRRLRVKVHHDSGLCGVDYSIKFNNLTTKQDVEFKFLFDPPIELKDDDTLTLGFSVVVATLRGAASDGTLSSEDDLKRQIESLQDRGSK